MKHFTVIELEAESECPMIGTIDNVIDNKIGKISFKERFEEALKAHFDVEIVKYEPIPDLFTGSPYEDLEVEIEGNSYRIRILETWIY